MYLLAAPKEYLPCFCPWFELGQGARGTHWKQASPACSEGGCSASWQGSMVAASDPKGSLGLTVSCHVMSRKRQSQVLWGAPEQRLRWTCCSGATDCGGMRCPSPQGRVQAGLHASVKHPAQNRACSEDRDGAVVAGWDGMQ